MGMDGFATIASSVGLVAITQVSALHSSAAALPLNFRETDRGHVHGTGCDRAGNSVPLRKMWKTRKYQCTA